ncbi:S8 family serine peptidase [Streptomyces sp. NPDC088762]|uniref:S8 family serine peptidase n=1 Tax=Streptomyces sp. NPDC088762 TaxID=3365891 RepID=UPI0037F329CD
MAATVGAGGTAAGVQPARAANPAAQDTTKTAAAAGAKPGAEATVTLITGDRVVVGRDGGVVRLRHGDGREKTAFSVRREPGHTYVIPQDAQRLVADGVLDRRLFDVARLVEDGYDDAHRSTLPLIVGYGTEAAAPGAFATAPDALGGVARERRPLPAVGGEAFTAPKAATAALWSAITGRADTRRAGPTPKTSIARVWLDGKVRAALDTSVPQIGAPAMWQAGYTGKGVKVAVLDTGVDQNHPDLKDVEVAERNFSESPDSADRHGHGTHVASILAGTGAQSGGRYKGVAPDVELLDGKVLSDDGWGTDSEIVSGMQWAVDEGAKIVSMSLGGRDEPGLDPKEEAVARLSDRALFVVAAGNDGDRPGTIASPGAAAAALTVGAVDKQDRLADFSSRGPTADGASKPDVTAPGVDITAARSTQAWEPSPEPYVGKSGTSMATPHVAGAAALLLQQHPDRTGAQLKALLTGSATPDPALNPHQQGAGRIDLARAATAVVVCESGPVDFGTQLWPHTDDEPVGKTLTYRNHGTAPVTLRLSTSGTGPDGGPAPAGTFTVKDPVLTVPAGGSATTTVTADTRQGAADGTYGGSVLAAGDGQSVRTALLVVREVESYDVTLKHTDTAGAGTSDHTTVLFRMGDDPGRIDVPRSANGTVVQRLRKGEYHLESLVTSPDGTTAVFVQPVVKATAETTIALDSRKARPFAVTAPDPAARLVGANVGYTDPNARVSSSWAFDGQTQVRTAALGAKAPGLRAQYNGVWKTPGAAGENTEYRLAFQRNDSWFTGLNRTVRRSDVAEIKLGFGASVTGARAQLWPVPYDAESGYAIGTRDPIEQSAPLSGTQYLSANGFRWTWDAYQLNAEGEARIGYTTGEIAYTAGRRHVLNFNTGVVGPDLESSEERGATRSGDTIDANLPLFDDGSGHFGSTFLSGGYTRLESGGQVIAEESSGGWIHAEVPAGSAKYRLSTEATRAPEDTSTSTKVAAVWTFTSARTTTDEPVRLPLSTVRLSPKLNLDGTAPRGSDLKVPLHVGGTAAATGHVASLTVKVSYDGGSTWKPLTVTTDAKGGRSVTVRHPATARTASFQVDLRDRDGNTVRETITDAYRLTP